MDRKFTLSIGIILLAATAIFVFWEEPVLLSGLLLLIAYGKHKMFPIKSELLWFSLICVGGALTEILLVNFGGAWSYASSQLFDIPIWMPLFWGVVGTTVVVAYDGLTKHHK
jgi:hypothetical protein